MCRFHSKSLTRRTFLKVSAAAASAYTLPVFGTDADVPHPLYPQGGYQKINSADRRFHISTHVGILDSGTDLPALWKESGITDAWVDVWCYGHYPFPAEKIDQTLDHLQQIGITPHFIAVPFCHNGGALSPTDPNGFPNIPPKHWRPAKRFDGSETWGFSWHTPADDELLESSRTILKKYGPNDYFLDDDFRFANAPGDIGGCVCDECRADFFKKTGIPESRWDELVTDWKDHRDTPLLRSWIDYFCDKLTYCFRKTAEGVPEIDLGIMVMYMGSECSGIRLDDYSGHLFRVGEGMFNDGSFFPLKNKMIELFSSLFHRRFCEPGRAFSETTGYRVANLSPENMAAKLTVSTLSDVRNTMFMSGLEDIPASYWPILAPRIKKEAEYHRQLAGRKPIGPFKHFWGTADRYMGKANPFALFLASGVPFEVCGSLPSDGWTFLGDASADEMERGELLSPGTSCLARFTSEAGRFTKLEETPEEIFKFRRRLLPQFRKEKVPYIEEEIPFIIGRYTKGDGSRDLLLLWNLNPEEKTVQVCIGETKQSVTVKALDSALLPVFA